MRTILRTSAFFCLALSSCAPRAPVAHPAVARATLDLECSEAHLTQKTIDETTVQVSGCGKRAVYVENCQQRFSAGASAALGMPATSKDCSWVPKSSTAKPE